MCILFVSGSTSGTTVAGWYTSAGSSIGQFNTPTAVHVDVNGSIYVLDSGNYRVQKWFSGEPFGRTIVGGQGNGTTLNKISKAYAFYVDSQTNIYVSDYGNHRVSLWVTGNTTAGKLVSVSIRSNQYSIGNLFQGSWR